MNNYGDKDGHQFSNFLLKTNRQALEERVKC